MQPVPDLAPILDPLRWALIGGIALRAYAPERTTLDVDVLIHERDADAVRESFVGVGYEITGELNIGGFTAREPSPDAMPVDVVTRSDPWLEDALANPGYDAVGYPVLTLRCSSCRPDPPRISPTSNGSSPARRVLSAPRPDG